MITKCKNNENFESFETSLNNCKNIDDFYNKNK